MQGTDTPLRKSSNKKTTKCAKMVFFLISFYLFIKIQNVSFLRSPVDIIAINQITGYNHFFSSLLLLLFIYFFVLRFALRVLKPQVLVNTQSLVDVYLTVYNIVVPSAYLTHVRPKK